jgi:uncharacterized protein (UPF0548 family)
MFRLREPDGRLIREFLEQQRNLPFAYAGVGATGAKIPAGYTVDRNHILVGNGTADLERARQAIRRWEMFSTGWTRISDAGTPILPGETVAVVVSHFGFWSMHASRIVYVVDEPQTFGFAYGTLPGHAEAGEERFTVRMDPADGSVWYEILAFSRPKSLARLAWPVSRMLQKRFARDSKRAMVAAVSWPSSSAAEYR